MSSTLTNRDAETPSQPVRTARTRKRLLIGAAALAALAGVVWYGMQWWQTGRFIQSTDDAYVGGNVTALAAHVPGLIGAVLVQDNQHVAAGDLLVRLDQRDYDAVAERDQATIQARQATLDSLRAQQDEQQATIREQEADVGTRVAQAAFTLQDSNRYRELAKTAAGSRQDAQRSLSLDQQARSAVLAANAGLEAARQHFAVLGANVTQAEAMVVAAKADLRTAKLNLTWTEIRAPIDGYVGNRSAQVGAYAAAGSYLISVIPSTGLWVDANFKEDQLTHMAPGQAATVTADVLPDHPFRAHIVSLAPGTGDVFSVIPAENATGNFTKIVQRVPVRVQLDTGDPALAMLRPGLSTTVSIDTRPGDRRSGDKRP